MANVPFSPTAPDTQGVVSTPENSGDAGAVQHRIRVQLTDLAESLSTLLGSLPQPVRRAPDLVKQLGIDNPLACRVLRVAQAADAAEAIEFMPTINQVRRVVQRSAELAPGRAADRAIDSMARFDALVNELGIDQRGFESLVSSLSPKGVRRVELQHRRAAYRANAHMWGLSAEVVVSLMVLVPGATGTTLDLHAILGFVDARITRPSSVIMFGSRLRRPGVDDDNVPEADSAKISASDLMRPFSTVRDASLSEVQDSRGFRGTQVRFRGLRPKDAETIFVRRFVPDFVKTDTDERCASNTLVLWPAALNHKDMLIPSGLTDPSTVKVEAYARRDDPRRVFDLDPADRLPLHETAKHSAGVTSLPAAQCFPRLNELFQSVAGEHLSRGVTFDLYRSQVPFPMLHSLVCLRVDHVRRPHV